MTAKNVILGSIALGAVALLLGIAWRSQHILDAGLPPREVCVDREDAERRAFAFAGATGGAVAPVLGTGSMAPYIPAAPAGVDPLTTVVALTVSRLRSTYADIQPGALCTYRPEWPAPAAFVLHQAAAKDRDGWIMTGLHNRTYENRWRVTEANFVGIVARTFVWKQ